VLLPLSLWAALGCSKPVSLTVLVNPPSGGAPNLIEVRAYDEYRRLATEVIATPQLPGAIRLTELPAQSDQLRIVVVGMTAQKAVQALAGNRVSTPLSSTSQVRLDLAAGVADQDGDGVPDGLDDCPTVADIDQLDTVGFSHGVGDACRASDGGSDMGPAPGPDMAPNLGPTCPSAGVPFCDSFEGTQIDSSKWTIENDGSGKIEIDSSLAYRGHSSLHAHLNALPKSAYAAAIIKETATFPATEVYARAYVYVPSAFTNDPAAIVGASQTSGTGSGISLQLEQGGFSLYDDLRAPAQSTGNAGTMPKNTWVCVQWGVKVATAGSSRVWVGGVEQPAPALTADTTSTPPLGQLTVGLMTSAFLGNVPARDVWIDEIAVSTKPLGCP
jgi:hypothetical protein